jgi:D-tyrosyl-tRNA(Tyr) deacylase
MRTVIQRVSRAAVRVDGRTVGEIGRGLLVLLGIGKTDTPAAADWMIEKLLKLRIFPDDAGKMNRSVTDIAGGLLIVSQFTLYGELTKGTRPSFSDAMPPAEAEKFYREFMAKLRAATNLPVAEGQFAAMMAVELVNDGPVTIILESPGVGQASPRSSPATDIKTGGTPVQQSGPPLKPFDRHTTYTLSRRDMPHWRQDGCTYFVTFRLADSVPANLLRQWESLQPKPEFPEQFHQWLDQGHGMCVLRQPAVAEIVTMALQHFDGERYLLGEYVVMPNHVHALVTPLGSHTLSAILHSWKSFTAKRINRALGLTGKLWQDESFDHIARNEEALERFSAYIRDNPRTANLPPGHYRAGVGQASRLSFPGTHTGTGGTPVQQSGKMPEQHSSNA